MTNDEIKAIEEIQGTGGFRVLKDQVEKKLEKVKDVTQIDQSGLVAEQALARQLAYEVLSEFLSEMKLVSIQEKERKTYE